MPVVLVGQLPSEAIAIPESNLGASGGAKSLDEVDREGARLSVLCTVRILHPGVIERVLRNDATVCGTANPIAFEKLRNALLMHYHVRDSTAGAIGATQTTLLVNEIVERLRKRIGKQLGGQLPD